MENKIIFRKIKRKDLLKLFELGKEEFEGQEWFNKRFLESCIQRKSLGIIVIEKKKIIGAIFVDILDNPKSWIFFLVVKKDKRKKGIGTKLIKKIEQNLPKENYCLYVDCGEKDISAKNFYKKQGFKKVAKIKKLVWNKKSWINLSKNYKIINFF